MKIQFVGSGSAFNKEDGQSNALITVNDQTLLIDCGSYFWQFAPDLEIAPKDIQHVYVTHLHADHIGGLEELAFMTYFNPNLNKPHLLGNFHVIHDLWEQSLRGGLESVQAKQMSLDDYFEVERIPDNGACSLPWMNLTLKPVQTVHVVNDCTIKFSYGILLNEVDKDQWGPTVFFTSDTQFCPHQIIDFYKRADIIFQDCETAPYKSGVHAHYDDLKTLDPEVKKKMWLYHYQSNPPQRDALEGAEKAQWEIDGFAGFARRGLSIDVEEEIRRIENA